MKVLGIESSCDECAAAVVEDGQKVLSNVINSQIPFHAAYNGVVPEIASRKHTEWIQVVVQEAWLLLAGPGFWARSWWGLILPKPLPGPGSFLLLRWITC